MFAMIEGKLFDKWIPLKKVEVKDDKDLFLLLSDGSIEVSINFVSSLIILAQLSQASSTS